MIGVVIGRFQIDDLHLGHTLVLDRALAENDRLVVVLGCPRAPASARDPLDAGIRRAMIRRSYPAAVVATVVDCRSDSQWSLHVDRTLEFLFPGEPARLYGGRDSCLDRYSGRHEIVRLPDTPWRDCVSATAVRRNIGENARDSEDFRAGVIYAYENLQPRVYMCVDVVAWRTDHLGRAVAAVIRKADEALWRFPGGHVDPTDESLEHAAKRELLEETGIVAEFGLRYVGSVRVDDWRDRGVPGVGRITALYAARPMTGELRAGDDAADAAWLPLDGDLRAKIVPEHHALLQRFFDHIETP